MKKVYNKFVLLKHPLCKLSQRDGHVCETFFELERGIRRYEGETKSLHVTFDSMLDLDFEAGGPKPKQLLRFKFLMQDL